MARYKIFENTANGYQEKLKDGFNWPVFFLGPLWYLFNGMVAKGLAWGAVVIIAGMFTFGLAVPIVWIIVGFRANHEKEKQFLHQGWKFIGYDDLINKDEPKKVEQIPPKND